MPAGGASNYRLAAAMTKRASLQSYLTIRWLADRDKRGDAFALYAYFRWLDDAVDERLLRRHDRIALVERQRGLLAQATSGAPDAPSSRLDLTAEEDLLVRLATAGSDGAIRSLAAMLDVMHFDARRRGRAVTDAELDGYTHDLAVAVTEALHHCIGHGCASPQGDARYVAVTGAHITHMLRDLAEDLPAGYINVPQGVLEADDPSSADLHGPQMRAWVRDRVACARTSFAAGRKALSEVENPRCRLAGHAYIARFEWILDAIEHDGYRVRQAYPERATVRGGLKIATDGAKSAMAAGRTHG